MDNSRPLEGLDKAAALTLNWLSSQCHGANIKWWYDSAGNYIERNKGELIALIHSEISEALEAERKDLMDDHLPHLKGVAVELADALIRIFDYAGAFGIDLGEAWIKKMEYNASRPDHSYEVRDGKNGKKF